MPMPRSFGSSQVTFLPLMKICPSVMSSRPAMQLSSVDLPQPDGPSRTMNSPSVDVEVEVLQDLRRWPKVTREVADRDAAPSSQPFTAPAAMPRTNSLPETK